LNICTTFEESLRFHLIKEGSKTAEEEVSEEALFNFIIASALHLFSDVCFEASFADEPRESSVVAGRSEDKTKEDDGSDRLLASPRQRGPRQRDGDEISDDGGIAIAWGI
jgi:hypothetical protein